MKNLLRGLLFTIFLSLFITVALRSILTMGIFGRLERFLPTTNDQLLILVLTLLLINVFQFFNKSLVSYQKLEIGGTFLAIFSGGLVAGFLVNVEAFQNFAILISFEALIIFLWAFLVLNADEFLKQPFTKQKQSVLVSVGLIFVLSFLGLNSYRQRLSDEYEISHPKIIKYEPKLVTTWNKVILYGSGFGEKTNNLYKVIYDSGNELKVDSWANTEIVFELNVIENPLEIRVVRPSNYLDKTELRQSNPISLDFYLPGESTPELQKRYFEQLQNMSDKAKKIYGINIF